MSNYISLILKIRLFMSCQAHLQDSPVTVGVAVPRSRQLAAVMPARPRGRQRWTEHNRSSLHPERGGGVRCLLQHRRGRGWCAPVSTQAAGGAEPEAEGIEDAEVLVGAGGLWGAWAEES